MVHGDVSKFPKLTELSENVFNLWKKTKWLCFLLEKIKKLNKYL